MALGSTLMAIAVGLAWMLSRVSGKSYRKTSSFTMKQAWKVNKMFKGKK